MSSRSLGSWFFGLIVLGLGGCFDHHTVDEASISRDPSSVGNNDGENNGDGTNGDDTGGDNADDNSTGNNGDDEVDGGAPQPNPCDLVPEPLRPILCPGGGQTGGGATFGFPTGGGQSGGSNWGRPNNSGSGGSNGRPNTGGSNGRPNTGGSNGRPNTGGTNGGTTGGTAGSNPIAEIFGIDCKKLEPGDVFGQFICSLGGVFGGNGGGGFPGTTGGSSGGGSNGRNNR